MASDAKPTFHRGVALMLCENEAILEETMVSIDTTELDIQRIGGRAIVAPAYQLEAIREALQQRGTFPKVVGDIVTEELLAAQAAQEDEEAETSEQQEDE
ncbi:hypothetical protein FIV42_08390 [Persicimonas caeni]|uniref:Uncharacterized protein n=1 Tax=Persicimonas caeni TaxID=2292766 RepID=A0A4Y6PRV2_PERCE|nr:hypothetical protein [Persicimonas caeni]QDG50747.1 hypothetical protein FIV42_08390 [Persicimonas caeni]QED31968.1 hypothetical protein FRD00_08385 [Persicimonas caeni]